LADGGDAGLTDGVDERGVVVDLIGEFTAGARHIFGRDPGTRVARIAQRHVHDHCARRGEPAEW
jgi:hypothetical protein